MAAIKKYFTNEERIEARRTSKKKWRESHKKEIKEYVKINKEKQIEKTKKYVEENKEKINAQRKTYRDKNKEKINDRNKNYYDKTKYNKRKYYKLSNEEKIKDYQKKYNQENKETIKKCNNKYQIKRRKLDPLFKLTRNIRSTTTKSLKQNGYTKKSRTCQLIGCSFEEFKLYLESKFKSWMSWDNYGKYNGTLGFGWDIDHIIPLTSAKTEDELIKLFYYTNLQPLCSYINRDVKKNKLNFVI